MLKLSRGEPSRVISMFSRGVHIGIPLLYTCLFTSRKIYSVAGDATKYMKIYEYFSNFGKYVRILQYQYTKFQKFKNQHLFIISPITLKLTGFAVLCWTFGLVIYESVGRTFGVRRTFSVRGTLFICLKTIYFNPINLKTILLGEKRF